MTESQSQNSTTSEQIKRKFHESSRWNREVINYSQPIFVSTEDEAQALRRSFARFGFKSASKETNKGFKVWRIK